MKKEVHRKVYRKMNLSRISDGVIVKIVIGWIWWAVAVASMGLHRRCRFAQVSYICTNLKRF